MGIKSDLGGAQLKATALKQAVSSINQSSSVSKDTQTTVAGNTNAQDAIELAQTTAQQISQAVMAASANLQSVAEEFEALDNQIKQGFSIPGLGG